MQITTENTAKTNTLPNPADTLKEVLGAVAFMMENGQIARNAAPLVNILNATDKYHSDDMATLRQTIVGHFDLVDGQPLRCEQFEPYELWDSPEDKLRDAIANLKVKEFEPPFGDDYQRLFGSPTNEEPGEIYDEVYLSVKQKEFLEGVLKYWYNGKGETITDEEHLTLKDVTEQLFM
ncbi:hypothetical protein [Rufibacter sp. XAAS-G3-1]|uniref:hypothetical protein n=1 Tax=Rufibacter sp. XAAS-G3-1 TaxID=2729134 RepID=UPI0015E7872A|nr:hypothetical protein [Rufibacter sp. XAAS-G3-1]